CITLTVNHLRELEVCIEYKVGADAVGVCYCRQLPTCVNGDRRAPCRTPRVPDARQAVGAVYQSVRKVGGILDLNYPAARVVCDCGRVAKTISQLHGLPCIIEHDHRGVRVDPRPTTGAAKRTRDEFRELTRRGDEHSTNIPKVHGTGTAFANKS